MIHIKDFLVSNWRTNLAGFAVLVFAAGEYFGFARCSGDPTVHFLTGLGLVFAKDARSANSLLTLGRTE